ncbi:MAG: pyrroline-5-carboxylate reductase [Aquisalimonadaceae bacterium]
MAKQIITFIGGGNMARSLVGGLVADGFDPARIRVADPDPQQRHGLAQAFGIQSMESNLDAVRGADAVVLAVKPQVLRAVAEELAPALAGDKVLVVSIAAGVREPDLNRWLGGKAAVVRAMPNTPALVQSGATGLYANSRVDTGQRSLAESLMRAVGLTCWLEDEKLLDAVTGVSGSGPAYFFLLMELMEDAGARLGLSREMARLLTIQTAFGAAKMALESEDDPQTLRRRVTSPGGTTERAIRVLEEGDLRDLVEQAIRSSAERADALGNELGAQ